VDQHAVGVTGIVAIAGDVAAAINNQDAPAEHAGRPFGENATDRPRAADEQINVVEHACASPWLVAPRSIPAAADRSQFGDETKGEAEGG
jgi:hypothetical protein